MSMAINKSNTSPWVKGVIIFIVICFVGLGMGTALSSLGTSSPTPGASTTASQSTTATLDAIALTHTPTIQAIDASLTAQPKNYDLLVQQAQEYYDWAAQVQQATKGATGQDTPIWKAAVPYYRRAVMVKKTDSGVMTDYCVTMFYSGDATSAISFAKTVETAFPKFSPIVYNLGIFYLATNDTVDAKAQLNQYLAIDPTGPSAADAKAQLAKLK
jgi:predicted Zn-dependent protease